MKELYEKVSTGLNFVEREKATRAFWEKEKIFEKSVDMREGKKNFTFYDFVNFDIVPEIVFLFLSFTVKDFLLACNDLLLCEINVKSDKTNVVIKDGDERIETGLRKFGAMVGDFVEVGCNSVLNPGTVIGRNSTVYPRSNVRGVIPENCIYKSGKNVVAKKNN